MNLISSIVESDTSLQNLTQVLLQRLDEFDVKFAKQERVIGELQRTNEILQKTIAGQQKTIAGLSTKIARVSYPSSHIFFYDPQLNLSNPSQQTQILNALHRRVVLDQARDLIIDRYGFKISDLRLGGHRNQVERQAMLQSLLRMVRSALSSEDSDLLSDDALRMIFDGAKHTIRDAGNIVAHEASTSDISLAVLEGNLTPKQSETLSAIYIFTHNQEPQLK